MSEYGENCATVNMDGDISVGKLTVRRHEQLFFMNIKKISKRYEDERFCIWKVTLFNMLRRASVFWGGEHRIK